MKVIGVIPARSGSKGIPNKNIRLLNGKPLLAYSIEDALASKNIDRVIVSTDSEEYAEIAKHYGAEMPVLRPSKISQDSSIDLECFQHMLNFLKNEENYEADFCVHLRPTHPVRTVVDIDKMIDILVNNPVADSVRTVALSETTPYKMWRMDDMNLMFPVAECDIPEAYNVARQSLPKVYMQNACIDVVRSRVIVNEHSMSGKNILGYIQECDFDIDTESDFLFAELYLEVTEKLKHGKKLTICSDIDGVVATKNVDLNYASAFPMKHNINMLNKLFDLGHKIVLFTARGYSTGKNWEQITEQQLNSWGVRYSELIFGKPSAEIYIDDKMADFDFLKKII